MIYSRDLLGHLWFAVTICTTHPLAYWCSVLQRHRLMVKQAGPEVIKHVTCSTVHKTKMLKLF